jgi:peptidoglycan/LPS O-acetylase OafA/YrhL
LDPLRFIAAYGVLLYHYSIYWENKEFWSGVFEYGYLGVNFFFLLSGFVIMISAKNRDALQFAYARALRIYPTFILCLLITLTVTYFFSGIQYSLKEIFFNAIIANDYLDIPNIDGVYWTLQAELKFYGCVFLLLLAGIFHHWKWWVGIWLALAISFHFFKQPFFLGWFINPEYSFYFIGGVCAYQMYEDSQSVTAKIYFVIALVFAGIKSIGQTQDFLLSVDNSQKIAALFCNVLFFAFFYLLANGFFVMEKRGYLVTLGMISYPLYLIHNKAGKQVYEYFNQFNIGEPGVLLTTSALIILACWIANNAIKKVSKANFPRVHLVVK